MTARHGLWHGTVCSTQWTVPQVTGGYGWSTGGLIPTNSRARREHNHRAQCVDLRCRQRPPSTSYGSTVSQVRAVKHRRLAADDRSSESESKSDTESDCDRESGLDSDSDPDSDSNSSSIVVSSGRAGVAVLDMRVRWNSEGRYRAGRSRRPQLTRRRKAVGFHSNGAGPLV